MNQHSFNYQRLLDTPELEGKFELLHSKDADECVSWLSDNFSLPYGQIDWAEHPQAVKVEIEGLDYEALGKQLAGLWLEPETDVFVVWSDADEVVAFQWKDLLEHLEVVWLPGKEDVWVIPDDQSGCVELHHEKKLAFVRFVD